MPDPITEVIRTFRLHTSLDELNKVISEHTPDLSHHCPACHTVSPCTLLIAALHARREGPAT